MLPPDFRAALAHDFAPDFVTEDAADRAEYGRDWTRVFAPAPAAIAFPRTTAEVAKLLALCNAARVPVVPSGGRTGLAHPELQTAVGYACNSMLWDGTRPYNSWAPWMKAPR